MKRRKLSRTEWAALGEKVKAIYNLAGEVLNESGDVLTKAEQMKLVKPLIDKASACKMALDRKVYEQHPDWEDFTSVFYGQNAPRTLAE